MPFSMWQNMVANGADCPNALVPVAPPKSSRIAPWQYDREMYKRRNEVERLFRRLKGYRRIFSQFDKLDLAFEFI